MSVIHHLLHTQCLKYTIYLNGSRKAQPSMLLRRCRMFTATCFKQVKQPQHETAVWVVRKTSCFKKSEYSHQTTVRHSIMGCTQHHLLSNRVYMHIKRPYGIAVWGVRNTTCFQTRWICTSNDRTAQQCTVHRTLPTFKQNTYSQLQCGSRLQLACGAAFWVVGHVICAHTSIHIWFQGHCVTQIGSARTINIR